MEALAIFRLFHANTHSSHRYSRGPVDTAGAPLSKKSISVCQHLHLEQNKTKREITEQRSLSAVQPLLRILYPTFTPAGNKSLVLRVICLSWLLLSLVLLCVLSKIFFLSSWEIEATKRCIALNPLFKVLRTVFLLKVFRSDLRLTC